MTPTPEQQAVVERWMVEQLDSFLDHFLNPETGRINALYLAEVAAEDLNIYAPDGLTIPNWLFDVAEQFATEYPNWLPAWKEA